MAFGPLLNAMFFETAEVHYPLQVVLESDERGVRCPAIDEKFFIAYRRAAIEADEVVKAIIVPLTKKVSFRGKHKKKKEGSKKNLSARTSS